MNEKPKILIVDDDKHFHSNLKFAFSDYQFYSAYMPEEAEEILHQYHGAFDLVLLDLHFNSASDVKFHGVDLLDRIKENYNQLKVIVISNYIGKKFPFENLVGKAEYLLYKGDFNSILAWKKIFKEFLGNLIKPKKPQILLVDDEEAFYKNMKFAFPEYDFIYFDNPNGVLDAINPSSNYPLVIIDLQLDENDQTSEKRFDGGLDLIDSIRQSPNRIPIVVITSFGDTDVFLQALEKGANHCFDKNHFHRLRWKSKFEEYINSHK